MQKFSLQQHNDVLLAADGFAPGESSPANERASIRPPLGIYEVAGSYGFDLNEADFSASAFVQWFKGYSSAGYAYLNNLSAGDFGNLKMGSLQTDPDLGDPLYPFQVAPFTTLSTTQKAYNTNAIAGQYKVYTTPSKPGLGNPLQLAAFGAGTKADVMVNYYALTRYVSFQIYDALGFSLNPADGFLEATAFAWLQVHQPDIFAQFETQLAQIAAAEVTAAKAVDAKIANGLVKFAATAVAAVVAAGAITKVAAGTAKTAGSVATALGNNPALSGSGISQVLEDTGQVLNPTPLQTLKLWAQNNPDWAIFYGVVAVIVIYLIYRATRK